MDLSRRVRTEEWIDRPDVDPHELAGSLGFIERVNVLLGYTRTTISYLERFSRSWRRGETIRIADFATGTGDVPRAILRWAARKRWDVHVIGFDLHPQIARIAHASALRGTGAASTNGASGHPRLTILRGDALAAPLADASVDYSVCSMFLHHLDDDRAADVLREMSRVARRGIIAADLLRNRRAMIWIRFLTCLASPMVAHDARASVAQAFTLDEISRIADRAGLSHASVRRHFGHRFVLAADKPGEPNSTSARLA